MSQMKNLVMIVRWEPGLLGHDRWDEGTCVRAEVQEDELSGVRASRAIVRGEGLQEAALSNKEGLSGGKGAKVGSGFPQLIKTRESL